MIDRRSPNDKLLAHDASRLEAVAGGPIDIGIVLGSGLSSTLRDRFGATSLPYDTLLGLPVASLRGHAGEALVGTWHGKRLVAFAGRVHLYQGFSPLQVTVNVRLAHAAGAKVMILTNAAGGLNPDFSAGDLMLINDHINLTGRNPLLAWPHENLFVDMVDAYSSRLRGIMKSVAKPEHRLREGVYAGMLGPNYETAAEGRYLRTIGADAVGMSTVLETIFARFLGMGVAGISLITNVVGAAETSHGDVTEQAAQRAPHVADLLEGFISKL
ncbi:MAG TPA: purine-nucleoside phosphorylase [Candidatus Baltobacteraceae bacterium]|jgi:purine-nucleoside phosphorylase|nr:purine-nucleoside phosphorylase [Candidatus Baltobacteraceae bacterium]